MWDSEYAEKYYDLFDTQKQLYLPKVEEYAKIHSEKSCYQLTHKWYCDGRIIYEVKNSLDKYISMVIFK